MGSPAEPERAAGLRRALAPAAALALLSAVVAAAFTLAAEAGWLLLLLSLALLLAKTLLDALAQQPPPAPRQRPPKAAVDVLADLVARLPASEGAVALKLRELLVHRLSARTGLPVAEVEARAGEMVGDEVLAKLLRGELRLASERDVLDVLDRIDRL